jgi:pyrroline-5-carboxylate reductase
MPTISFIGGGTMAEAILVAALQKKLVRPADVCVGELVEERRAYLVEKHGVQAVPDNAQAAAGGDLVILAVKPQDMDAAMADLRGHLTATQTIISIAAGVRLSALAQGLDHQVVIRVMPNTPVQVMAGMSVWTAATAVSEGARKATLRLLDAMGRQIYVADEKYIDMATGLSASGPAYVWLFLEALIDAGVHIGLSRPMASILAQQTILGSVQMAEQTGQHPAELRNLVTSPGGTTTEALLVLEQAGFRAALMHAVQAAYEKSQLLSEGK